MEYNILNIKIKKFLKDKRKKEKNIPMVFVFDAIINGIIFFFFT